MIKVVVNGAKGKLGQEVCKAVRQDPELELVGESDLGDDLSAIIHKLGAQVVVDFTHPSVRMENIKKILEAGARGVIGTTGFLPPDLAEIEKWCHEKNLGVLIAPNFAIGAVLMMEFAAKAAKFMPNIEIVEYHHDQKADAPSGTAIKTAELINESVKEIKTPSVESKEMLPMRSQGAMIGNIRIHAIRLPGFVASQEVILGGLGQTLKIRHDTVGRDSFMPGVIMACKNIVNQTGLIYGLEKIL